MKFLGRLAHVVSIVILLLAPLASAQVAPQPSGQRGAANTQSNQGPPNVVVTVNFSNNDAQRTGPNDDTGKQENDARVAWATVVIAAFTIILAIATGGLIVVGLKQSNWMRKQAVAMEGQLAQATTAGNAASSAANTAEQTLAFAHRPRLLIRHIVVDGIDKGAVGERLFNGYMWITNVGALPVTLAKVYAEWILEKHLPIENPALHAIDNSTVPIDLLPAAFIKFPIPEHVLTSLDEHRALWHSEREDQRKEGRALFLVGYIKYTDQIGLRRTYFCYRYNSRMNRFVKVKHPNYNYTD